MLMPASFVPSKVSTERAPVSVSFEHVSAVLTTYAVIIADLFFVITVHKGLKYGELAVLRLLLSLQMKSENSGCT
jgi:hypothetical protein